MTPLVTRKALSGTVVLDDHSHQTRTAENKEKRKREKSNWDWFLKKFDDGELPRQGDRKRAQAAIDASGAARILKSWRPPGGPAARSNFPASGPLRHSDRTLAGQSDNRAFLRF